jgi:hypothetical protein
MKLHCFALNSDPPKIVPARASRQWMDDFPDRHAYRCLPLSIANAHAARFPFEASSTAFRKALERGSGQCASDDGAAGAATLRISGTIRLATTKAIMIARKASA